MPFHNGGNDKFLSVHRVLFLEYDFILFFSILYNYIVINSSLDKNIFHHSLNFLYITLTFTQSNNETIVIDPGVNVFVIISNICMVFQVMLIFGIDIMDNDRFEFLIKTLDVYFDKHV